MSSVTSPSYTSFVSLIRSPIARRKFSISTSVFFTSDEKTSEPTIGQNGTFGPSSCASASAIAVLPVPGAPASISARPAIFFVLISSTTTPHASRAFSCPTSPPPTSTALPSSARPSPLTWLCAATRCCFVVDLTSSIFIVRPRSAADAATRAFARCVHTACGRCDASRVDLAHSLRCREF